MIPDRAPIPQSLIDRVDRIALGPLTKDWTQASLNFPGPNEVGRDQARRGLVEWEKRDGRWWARLTDAGHQLLTAGKEAAE